MATLLYYTSDFCSFHEFQLFLHFFTYFYFASVHVYICAYILVHPYKHKYCFAHTSLITYNGLSVTFNFCAVK